MVSPWVIFAGLESYPLFFKGIMRSDEPWNSYEPTNAMRFLLSKVAEFLCELKVVSAYFLGSIFACKKGISG